MHSPTQAYQQGEVNFCKGQLLILGPLILYVAIIQVDT